MDIVESLRKYQCPENKGCNPVVEYCQCALMDSGADEIERLREALHTIGYGPPHEGEPLKLLNQFVDLARSALQQRANECLTTKQ